LILLFLVIASMLLVIAGCQATKSNSGTSTSALRKAPEFQVKTLTGDTATLDTILEPGKPVVANFAASWCGPCEYEAPVLVKLHEKYKDRVTFFGFAVKDKEENQRKFVQKHGITFPVGLDPSQKAEGDFLKAGKVQFSAIPMTYFLSSDGYIKDVIIGPVTEKSFEQKIGPLL
ncbi:MAG: TlpA disulfide reductase family protein, partial [Actinomycetota bacterium]